MSEDSPTAYRVRATRWADGWELDIEGLGVTQAHTVEGVDHLVRDFIRLDLGDAAAEAAVIDLVLVD